MGTIKETILDIGKPIRRLINNIRMSWRWAKFGWNDRDFDYVYLYNVMKFKIDNMERTFVKYGYHDNNDYTTSRMRLISRLLDKVSTEFYEMEYWDYIYDENHNKIDKIDNYLEANKHNYRRSGKHFSTRGRNMKSFNVKEACAMDIGHYKHKKAKRLLFQLLEHRIDWFWD